MFNADAIAASKGSSIALPVHLYMQAKKKINLTLHNQEMFHQTVTEKATGAYPDQSDLDL